MRYSVKRLARAEQDLDEICAWLSQFYPGTVGRFLDAFEAGINNLEENPYMYRTYPENPVYRRLLVQDYLAFYRVDEDLHEVKIYRVLHGKRDLPKLLV
jgi:plasmid stabilization system protein ParE